MDDMTLCSCCNKNIEAYSFYDEDDTKELFCSEWCCFAKKRLWVQSVQDEKNKKTGDRINLLFKGMSSRVEEQNKVIEKLLLAARVFNLDYNLCHAEYIYPMSKYRLEMLDRGDDCGVYYLALHSKGDSNLKSNIMDEPLETRLYFFNFINNSINYFISELEKQL